MKKYLLIASLFISSVAGATGVGGGSRMPAFPTSYASKLGVQPDGRPTKGISVQGTGDLLLDNHNRIAVRISQPNNSIAETWNGTGSWDYLSNLVNTYDSLTRVIQTVEIDTTTNDSLSRSTFSYDPATGLIAESITESNSGTGFTPNQKTNYTYDRGNVSRIELFVDNGAGWEIADAITITYTFGASGANAGKIISRIVARRNGTSGTIIPLFKDTYSYPASGPAANSWTRLVEQNYTASTGVYVNSVRISSAIWFDFKRQWYTSAFYDIWSQGAWTMNIASYSGTLNNGEYVELFGINRTTGFEPLSRSSTTIDAFDEVILEKEESYNDTTSSFEVDSFDETVFVRDANGNVITEIQKSLASAGDTTENSVRFRFSSFVPVAAKAKAEKLNVTVGPNPVAAFVVVNGLKANASATIVDVNGRTVSKSTLTANSNRLNTASLGSGIYTLRLVSGNAATTVKFVK